MTGIMQFSASAIESLFCMIVLLVMFDTRLTFLTFDRPSTVKM